MALILVEWPVRLGCTKPGILLTISNVTLGGLRMQSTSTCGKALGALYGQNMSEVKFQLHVHMV